MTFASERSVPLSDHHLDELSLTGDARTELACLFIAERPRLWLDRLGGA